MSGFVLHPEALADLQEIWEYIAADNLDAAGGTVSSDSRSHFLSSTGPPSLGPDRSTAEVSIGPRLSNRLCT